MLLDALTYSVRENMVELLRDPRVSFVEGSITDEALTKSALRGAHAVVHLAAESHVDRSITGARAFYETNVIGTHQLLESARDGDVQRFVHVSTDEVYGSIGEGSWREDNLLEPNSPYSSSKAGSDLAALAYHRTYGIPVMVTRCSNNYGPRQFPEKVIPLFVTEPLRRRQGSPLRGRSERSRLALRRRPLPGHPLRPRGGRAGEIYNIGGGTELTNEELTTRLLDLCGFSDSMIQPTTDRLGHDRRYSVDWSKIKNELGYEPQMSFDEGLAQTVKWYHDNEAWWRPLKSRP